MDVIILSGADDTGKTAVLHRLSKELSCKYPQIPYCGKYTNYNESSSCDLICAYEIEIDKVIVITSKGDNKEEIQKNIDAVNELLNFKALQNRNIIWITASRTKGESIDAVLVYCKQKGWKYEIVKTKNLKGLGDVCPKKDNERVLQDIKDLLKKENITLWG